MLEDPENSENPENPEGPEDPEDLEHLGSWRTGHEGSGMKEHDVSHDPAAPAA